MDSMRNCGFVIVAPSCKKRTESAVSTHLVKDFLAVVAAVSYNLDIWYVVRSVKLFAMEGVGPGAYSRMRRVLRSPSS